MTNSNPVQELRVQFQKLRRLYFLFLVLAVLALILYFAEPRLTLALLGISLILNLVPGRRKSREYKQNFVHLSAQLTLEKHLSGARHSSTPVLTEEIVRSARMLPCNASRGGVVCHEGGDGWYQGRRVTLGDITLAHTFTSAGKKRHSFTVGCWVTVELEKDTGLDCRFIGKNTIPDLSLKEMLQAESDLKQISVPATLKSGWRVICAGDNPSLPNDTFLNHLEKLHRKTDGLLAVSVQGNRLHILLINTILAQKVNSRMPPGPQFEKADLLPDLSHALLLSTFLAT